MAMKNLKLIQSILYGCLVLMLDVSTCYAEIFKWVDADGHTHFSENKNEVGATKAVEVKVIAPPPSSEVSTPPSKSWPEPAIILDKRQINRQKFPITTQLKPQSGSTSSESAEASRCRLARNVISGAVRHRNGAVTDQYDRETAQNDIRTSCH